jgi:hypothetical protein
MVETGNVCVERGGKEQEEYQKSWEDSENGGKCEWGCGEEKKDDSRVKIIS